MWFQFVALNNALRLVSTFVYWIFGSQNVNCLIFSEIPWSCWRQVYLLNKNTGCNGGDNKTGGLQTFRRTIKGHHWP